MVSGLGGVLGALGGSTIGASVVSLILDTKRFDAGLVSAKGRLVSATGQMQAGASKLGFAAKAGLGLAAVALVKFASDGAKAAIDARDAQSKLANSIENSAVVTRAATPRFLEQAEAIRKLTGADDENIVRSQAFLVQMGLTEDQVRRLVPLTVDLATKMNVDLQTATKAVGRAATGTVVGLTRMGVVVDKDRATTDAFGATLEALGASAGFAAQKAEDEPWRRLGSAYEELAETVGEELMPVLVDFVDWMADIVENAGPTVEAIGDIIGGLADLASFRIPGSDDWIEVWDNIREALAAGAITAEQAHDAITELEAIGYPGVTERAAEFHQEVGEVTHGLQLSQLAASGYSGTLADMAPRLDEAGNAARGAGRGMRRFAGLTDEALKDFKDAARESLNFAAARFEDLESRANISARGILRALRRANRDQKEFAENARTFLQRVHEDFGPGMERAAEQMLQALAEAGPEGAERLDALAGANRKVIREILREWRESEDRARDLTRRIGSIGEAIDRVEGDHTINFRVNYSSTGDAGPAGRQIEDYLASQLAREGTP